jgi:hypothetical protein
LRLHPHDQEVIGNLMRAFVARRETAETPALDQAVRALWDLFEELMPRLACAGCGREGLRSNFDERTIDCPACGLLILQLREPPNAAPIPGAAREG